MSPENQFILGSKSQMSRSRVTNTWPAWVFAFLWVLASSSYKLAGNSTLEEFYQSVTLTF